MTCSALSSHLSSGSLTFHLQYDHIVLTQSRKRLGVPGTFLCVDKHIILLMVIKTVGLYFNIYRHSVCTAGRTDRSVCFSQCITKIW